MRFDTTQSKAQILDALTEEAVETWGAARAEGIKARIELVAGWLWQIAQQPLDALDEEPDFIDGARRRDDLSMEPGAGGEGK